MENATTLITSTRYVSVSILQYRIDSDASFGSTISRFQVLVSTLFTAWKLSRSSRNFIDLQTALSGRFPSLLSAVDFPFDQPNYVVDDDFKKRLEAYLIIITQSPDLSDFEPLLSFLDDPDSSFRMQLRVLKSAERCDILENFCFKLNTQFNRVASALENAISTIDCLSLEIRDLKAARLIEGQSSAGAPVAGPTDFSDFGNTYFESHDRFGTEVNISDSAVWLHHVESYNWSLIASALNWPSADDLTHQPLASTSAKKLWDAEMSYVLTLVSPLEASVLRRGRVAELVAQQIKRLLGVHVFEIGPHALRCFLPDEPVSLCICQGKGTKEAAAWYVQLNERFCMAASSTSNGVSPRSSRSSSPRPSRSGSPRPPGAPSRQDNSLSPRSSPRAEILDQTENMEDGMRFLTVSEIGRTLTELPKTASLYAADESLAFTNVSFVTDDEGGHRLICLIDGGMQIEILSNTSKELIMLAFLEDFDVLVCKNHLFKRSFILIHAWLMYEAGATAALFPHGALAVLLVAVFIRFDRVINSPYDALVLFFLQYAFSEPFTTVFTIFGPVDIKTYLTMDVSSTAMPSTLSPGCALLASLVQNLNLTELPSSYVDIISKYTNLAQGIDDSIASVLSEKASDATAFDDSLSAPMQVFNPVSSAENPGQLKPPAFALRPFMIAHPFIASKENMLSDLSSEMNTHRRAVRLLEIFRRGAHVFCSALLTSVGPPLGVSGGVSDEGVAAIAAQFNHRDWVQQRAFKTVTHRFGRGWRPDIVDPKDEFETESKDWSAGDFFPYNQGGNVGCGDLYSLPADRLINRVRYANLLLEALISETALHILSMEILAEKGVLPVGEIGKMLQEITTMNNMSAALKEKFGGLKKFLERYSEDFVISCDHPFNPHVYLRAQLTAEDAALVLRGEQPRLGPLGMRVKSKKNKDKSAGAGHTGRGSILAAAHASGATGTGAGGISVVVPGAMSAQQWASFANRKGFPPPLPQPQSTPPSVLPYDQNKSSNSGQYGYKGNMGSSITGSMVGAALNISGGQGFVQSGSSFLPTQRAQKRNTITSHRNASLGGSLEPGRSENSAVDLKAWSHQQSSGSGMGMGMDTSYRVPISGGGTFNQMPMARTQQSISSASFSPQQPLQQHQSMYQTMQANAFSYEDFSHETFLQQQQQWSDGAAIVVSHDSIQQSHLHNQEEGGPSSFPVQQQRQQFRGNDSMGHHFENSQGGNSYAPLGSLFGGASQSDGPGSASLFTSETGLGGSGSSPGRILGDQFNAGSKLNRPLQYDEYNFNM